MNRISIHAWRGSAVSTKVDTTNTTQNAVPTDRSKLSKAGGSGCGA